MPPTPLMFQLREFFLRLVFYWFFFPLTYNLLLLSFSIITSLPSEHLGSSFTSSNRRYSFKLPLIAWSQLLRNRCWAKRSLWSLIIFKCWGFSNICEGKGWNILPTVLILQKDNAQILQDKKKKNYLVISLSNPKQKWNVMRCGF